jgi:carboxypeptidase Taq
MYGLPLGDPVSLGIHESQSRLWENHVGRSRLFWQAKYPKLQQHFPGKFDAVSLDDFYRGINKIKPTLIRTESDELHYHFHVLIRYEIEKSLIDKSLEVGDLVDAWNSMYKEYLDLDVPDPNRGVLQDIHWAHGSIGYFPTYSLGSFYAAQFFAQAQRDIPALDEQLGKGNAKPLLKWLREKIHRHGRFYSAEDLCREVTGEALDFKYFMAYAKKKYEEIYG